MIPTTIDGRKVLAAVPYNDSFNEYVIITEWDDPTPYVIRPIHCDNDGKWHWGGGYYCFTWERAYNQLILQLPSPKQEKK